MTHGSRLVFHDSRLVFHDSSPKYTDPNCILARRSSLGPPPVGRHRTFSDDADDDFDDRDPDMVTVMMSMMTFRLASFTLHIFSTRRGRQER